MLLAGGNYLMKTVTEVDGHVVEALDEGIELTVRAPSASIGGRSSSPASGGTLPSSPWGVQILSCVKGDS